jgi:hypothetical protein
MKKNRVYTLTLLQTAPAASDADVQWFIENPNREALLKSISFDIQIRYPGVAITNVLPLEQNTTQSFRLLIFSIPVGNLFAQALGTITEDIAGSVNANGNAIHIFKPGQLNFNSFYINNGLIVHFQYHNYDAAVAHTYQAQFNFEIEDIPLRLAR